MVKLRNTGTFTISTGTITASGNYLTDPLDCQGLEGFFSLEWIVTGDGTCKIEVLPSNDGSNYPDVEPDIASSQTKTSGPAADGINMDSFQPIPCNFMKLLFTETGGVSAVAVTARLRAN
jgi:hypothetical protein